MTFNALKINLLLMLACKIFCDREMLNKSPKKIELTRPVSNALISPKFTKCGMYFGRILKQRIYI